MVNQKILNYFQSFAFFFKFLKFRVFVLVALSFLVGLLDGFGLSMFLPLLQIADGQTDLDTEQMGGMAFIIDFFENVNLPLNIYSVLIVILIFFSLKGLFKFVEGFFRVVYQQYFIRNIRISNALALANLSYQSFVNSDSGRIQNTFSAEVERVSGAFRTYFMTAQAAILVGVYIGLAFLSNAQFAILISIGGAITNLVFKKLYAATKKASRSYTAKAHKFQGLLIQKVTNFKYLKATGLVHNYLEKFKESIFDIESTQRRIGTLGAIMQAIREPLVMFVVVVVILVQVNFFSESIGAIVLSLLFFYRALSSLMRMQNYWNSFLGVSGSLDNMTAFMKELKDGEEHYGNRSVAPFQDSLVLSKVDFNFGEVKILEEIDLHFNKNETVAIVGESGSGKTTLMNLMVGLLKPSKGGIDIDGVSFDDIDIRSLQRRVGYITQEPVVFNDTIFNNITFWDEPSEQNVLRFEKALKEATIYEFIDQLEKKEKTLLGNNGVNLSGGQRQRLSIARELYKEVDFLMMDEATSALDSETELAIQKNIDSLRGNYTILIIAHRLSTVKDADRIVLMKKGRVQGTGTFEQLIESSGEFKRMVTLQDFA